MTDRKVQQVIWLDQITFYDLNQIYIKSGAFRVMAINQFISKIIEFFTQNQEILESFLKKMHTLQPTIKEYSFFVEKVEKVVEKPVKELVYICFICKETIPQDQMNLLLAKHMEKHFVCYKCFTKFNSEAELYNHYKTHQ